jgi:hypothetical protein
MQYYAGLGCEIKIDVYLRVHRLMEAVTRSVQLIRLRPHYYSPLPEGRGEILTYRLDKALFPA